VLALALFAVHAPASARPLGAEPPVPTLESLPRPTTPPPAAAVRDLHVERWRRDATAAEHGEGVERDLPRAAALYCRASRHGDAESQFALGWMLVNGRGVERNDAHAAHLFAAAAEQGLDQARNMAARLGTPLGAPPPCLRAPEDDPPPVRTAAAPPRPGPAAGPAMPPAPAVPPPPPPPPGAPEALVRFVRLVAPTYGLQPHVVLALIAQESGFDAGAVSPKRAMGLMQLIPETAERFGVRNPMDPTQNLRGGMAYLRWLLAYFEGDLRLALAAYNAGEGAVDRWRGIPPYAETRHYVRRIVANLNGQLTHPFDAGVTPPSPVFAMARGRP
jgi:soluble lytic murein transglycosylase-like protein